MPTMGDLLEVRTATRRVVAEAKAPASITTTLYDLIAAIQTMVRPEHDDLVVATIVHLLRTGQLTCRGETVMSLDGEDLETSRRHKHPGGSIPGPCGQKAQNWLDSKVYAPHRPSFGWQAAYPTRILDTN